MRSRFLAVFLLVSLLGVFPAHSQELLTILDTGPTDRRINIVFLAEGYQQHEQNTFVAHAQNILGEMLNTDPYADYVEYFNAYAIFVASNESGSSHPSQGIQRDTYFQSTFESFGIDRLVSLSGTGNTRAFQLLRDLMPEYDIPALIVNDSRYGGSGGWLAITSVHQSAPDIMIHEIGHSFAQLADEYDTPYPGWMPREFRNATARAYDIPWQVWIEAGTPIPTPSGPQFREHVGLFEGAQYHATGWYRPKDQCKMRMLGVPFCEVCQEAHIEHIYTKLSPIEAAFPLESSLTAAMGDIITFDVAATQPARGLEFDWFVNGTRTESSGHLFDFDTGESGAGEYRITAVVSDPTPRVRQESVAMLMVDESHWDVLVEAGTSAESTLYTPDVALHGNAPNPFVDATTISFTLPAGANVRLDVYDALGRLVATPVVGTLDAGRHDAAFNAGDLPSGLFLYRLTVTTGTSAGSTHSRVMLLVR